MPERSGVVLVSGGSRGLGAELVRDLLEHSWAVATFSRSRSGWIEEAEGAYGDRFRWAAIDGTSYAELGRYVESVREQFGAIDGLVNNTGVAMDGVLTMMKAEDVGRLLEVNLEATIRLTQMVAKSMLADGRGSIVNISSIVGLRGYSGLSVYSATKGALDAFSRALARELGPRSIRVNSVAPGYLDTGMSESLGARDRERIVRRTPLGRLGELRDVTGIVRFLLSDEARFMTGQTLVVDGGITC